MSLVLSFSLPRDGGTKSEGEAAQNMQSFQLTSVIGLMVNISVLITFLITVVVGGFKLFRKLDMITELSTETSELSRALAETRKRSEEWHDNHLWHDHRMRR